MCTEDQIAGTFYPLILNVVASNRRKKSSLYFIIQLDYAAIAILFPRDACHNRGTRFGN
jgi:hypothetical protein